MNRPNKKNDPNYPWEFPDTYLRELEKYCDFLEVKLAMLDNLVGFADEVMSQRDDAERKIGEIKEVLHSGMWPEYYKEAIEEILDE